MLKNNENGPIGCMAAMRYIVVIRLFPPYLQHATISFIAERLVCFTLSGHADTDRRTVIVRHFYKSRFRIYVI